MKFKVFLFFYDKMLQIERTRFDLFWGHLISKLMNSKFQIWSEISSKFSEKLHFLFCFLKASNHFRWFAFEKWFLLMQNLTFSKKSEFSGSETFISDDFISSRKCPNLMVDPSLESWKSEVFNALFDVITALFPAVLQ